MRNKLVVHTEASIGWGGQEIRTLTQLKYMQSRGYETLLVAPQRSDIYKAAVDEGLPVYHLPLTKASQLLDFFALWGVFRHRKPLCVSTHSSIDSWVALSAAKAAKVPLTIRYRHISAPTKNAPQNRFLYRKLADEVITTSNVITDQISGELGIDRTKFHTIPTGIAPPADMPEREASRVALADKLSLGSDARFVGMVAIVRSWKGHQFLIKAFEKIADQFPSHHLVIVGDGPMLPVLRNETIPNTSVANRIHTVGQQTNVFDYFCAFDAAVLSSFNNEAIPQSLMQAMFAKTPVVGSRLGGIPEIVHDGETGLLAEPADADSLADALARTLQNSEDAAMRVANAHRMVCEKHTVEAMGQAVEAIIRRYNPQLND